ncbi:MAG: NUDIX hydrolase [Anaerolineales bacterium]
MTAQVDKSISKLSEQDIIERLAEADVPIDGPYPKGLLKENLRPAAVLIPFVRRDHAWHLLLIRRAEHAEDFHSGQVAFPGGGAHPGDLRPENTALRETYEEIGVLPQDVRILGRLNEFVTISSYLVTPIVGVIPWPYSFVMAGAEVSRVFTIPLDWLADPKNHEIQQRELPPPYTPISVIYFLPYDGEVLWGASARFTVGLIELLTK